MQIEKIFGEIPIFHDIKIDKILFESSYPILFTCIENRNIYLFICCVNNLDETKWIGTKTSFPNLTSNFSYKNIFLLKKDIYEISVLGRRAVL